MKLFFKAVIFCVLFFSCSKNEGILKLELPEDSAMNDANRYAVIIETYISIRDKPGDDGITTSHARRLDIFKIEGIEIEKKGEEQILWVNVGSGWVPRSSVQLYSSKEKAETAGKKLKQ